MSNPTLQKRDKEKARQELQREKDAARKARRANKPNRGPGEDGIDPDIAGIIPGPQPLPDED
jgi:hypothetical protein